MIAFILPYLTRYGAYGAILAACWLHGCHFGEKRESGRTEAVKADYLQFRQNVETAGKLAQQNADIVAARNAEKAKASDESYSKALSVLGTDLERLRKRTDSGSYSLPAPGPSATCPEGQRCFDRGEFDTALRIFEGEVLTLVGEGATLKLRMDESIKWANRLN